MAKENNIFDEIYNRLLGLGIQSQKDLASILGISSASVWKAKNENRFPKKWISILCQTYNKSPEWFFGERSTPPASLETNLIKSLMEDILELKNQLNYMEGTISLLREEIDLMKPYSPAYQKKNAKKNGQDYIHQQEAKEEPLALTS